MPERRRHRALEPKDLKWFDGDTEDLVKNSAIYNELVVNRYDRDGKVLKPDYIISYGRPSDPHKKHAAFFGVPIVVINNSREHTES